MFLKLHAVMFVISPNRKCFLFPLVIMHLLPLLNWFIVTFGVLLLLALLKVTNTFLPLWMIFQDALGFIFLNLNQILRFYFQVLLKWLELNLIATLRPLEVIMVHNFTLKTSFTPMVSCTNYLVLILLNKMPLLRGSINIYLMLLGHWDVNIRFPCVFGVTAFSL